MIFLGQIPVTFYFDKDGNWIRFDFVETLTNASVVNNFFNMDSTKNIIDKEIFDGLNDCHSIMK